MRRLKTLRYFLAFLFGTGASFFGSHFAILALIGLESGSEARFVHSYGSLR